MKKTLYTLALLLSLGSTVCIEQAAADVYIIRNQSDWLAFRDAVGSAGSNRVDARLECDITTDAVIGWNEANAYCGTFDGNGHTLHVNYHRDENGLYGGGHIAPFRYVGNATFKDLHVTGRVYGGQHAGGLIGYCANASSYVIIERVRVSTDVNSNNSFAGGIIAHSNKANVYMYDCLFDGNVTATGSDSYNTYAGEIIGWANQGGTNKWRLMRVYDNGSPNAHWMFFCIHYIENEGFQSWGKGDNSLTVSRHSVWDQDYTGKENQSDVVSIMNNYKAYSWDLVDGKAVPKMKTHTNRSESLNENWIYLSEGSYEGCTLGSGRYYVTQDITISNFLAGSGLTIANGATVYIYVPAGVTLTALGGAANGMAGAGAGIELPESSTLYLMGKGKVKATGGNAANGGNGENGGNAGYSYDKWTETGAGGRGGDGGGGAGAGIGTRGADGGAGGNGGSSNHYTDWKVHDGTNGSEGNPGRTAAAMGTLFVDKTYNLDVDANGGGQGASSGNGGNRGDCYIDDDAGNNYSMSGGGGGGGGGFGGMAAKIGTGGCGGGGGGGGAGGAQDWRDTKYYNVYSWGGKGGKNADGNVYDSQTGKMSDCDYRNSYTYSNYSWSDNDYKDKSGDCSMGSGGNGGTKGYESEFQDITNNYILKFNVLNQAGDNTVADHATITYQSNKSNANIPVTIPTTYKLGLIKADKYVSRWYTSNACTGNSQAANDVKIIVLGDNNLYGVWQNYNAIFPEGTGTKNNPFIVKDDGLMDLATYVNQGGNTRGVYFKQEGEINMEEHTWTPIGHSRVFEGDYDGGGYRIVNAENTSCNYDAFGIFGKVSGSIHNLGVEHCDLQTTRNNSRGGAIAGMLLRCDLDEHTTAEISNCYAAQNTVKGTYSGGLVGEMINASIMSHCLESNNTLHNNYGGLASLISNDCQVDKCFAGGTFSSNGYNWQRDSEANVSSSRLESGEITWLLNDRASHGGGWYQTIGTDLYPVLDKEHKRVFYSNSEYTNTPSGIIFIVLKGQGTAEKPFLIRSKDDFWNMATFCNYNNSLGMHFLQTEDIDGNNAPYNNEWRPAGIPEYPHESKYAFRGHYDGGGHTIRNVTMDTNTNDESFLGIFGVVTGTVDRLCAENITITGTGNKRLGAIVGRVRGNGVISNCFVKSSHINADANNNGVGGAVAGDMYDDAVISNCFTYNNTVTGASKGHICGEMLNTTTIRRCYTTHQGNDNMVGYQDSQATMDEVQTIASDDEGLLSGTFTYLLNNDNKPDSLSCAWFQNISLGNGDPRTIDPTPVLSPDHALVFKINNNYTNDYRGINSSTKGYGTQAKPYLVENATDLKNISETFEAMSYSNFYVKQTADIDLAEAEPFAPIGIRTEGFAGHYDGGGHIISHWSNSDQKGITRANVYDSNPRSLGFFNNITGTVERLGIVNSAFAVDANANNVNRVGAFAGKMTGNAQLLNCYVANSTVSYGYKTDVVVGGLVGEMADQSNIGNSYGCLNTVLGETKDNQKQYGDIVGYIGSNAAASRVYTDGVSLCADNQPGANKFTNSERNVTELRFRTGEMTYLLNNEVDYNNTQSILAWCQTIKDDPIPVLQIEGNNTHMPVYKYTAANGAQTMYANDAPYTVALSLYPNYEEEGTPMDATVVDVFKKDDRYYVPAYNLGNSIPNRNYYAFAGWNAKASCDSTHYDKNSEILVSKATNLYAEWDMTVPSDGTTFRVDLPMNKTFNIYDAAGKDNNYDYNYGGKLVLKAPESDSETNNIIYLTGTIATETLGAGSQRRDYLVIRDGGPDGDIMSNAQSTEVDGFGHVFVSATDGVEKNIGRLLSTKDSITIEFYSDNANNFAGLRLRATVISNINNLGMGTESNPFKVNCAADLATIQEYIQASHNTGIWIKQTADIDLDDANLIPLGQGEPGGFVGHYDGGGYVIKNGNIETTDGHLTAGIFSIVTGTVTRLGVENITVQGLHANARIGGIAGRVDGNAVISNCYVKNSTLTSSVACVAGGIVADMYDQAAIRNCFTLGNTITATKKAHICSEMNTGTQITRCYTGGDQLVRKQEGTVTDCSTSITDYQLKSGEICHLLNGASSAEDVVWRQTIGTDAHPVPDSQSPIVYYYDQQGHQGYTNEASFALATLRVQDVAFNQSVDHQAIRGSLIRLNNYPPERANLTLAEWNTQADFTGTSYTPDANLLLNTDVIILYPKWNVMPQVITGEGTEQSPFIIASTEDWNKLATNITYFNTTFNGYQGKYIRLDADISVTEMVGTVDETNAFKGTFDGNDHTLTVNYDGGETRKTAPFRNLNGATIKNLKVAGSITSANAYGAGIAGMVIGGTTNINNCHVSATVNCTWTGSSGTSTSGFVGCVEAGARLNIKGCVFTGSLTGNVWYCAGFVAYRVGTITIEDCLFVPTELTVREASFATFIRSGSITRCYYTLSHNSNQGTLAQVTATENEINRKVTVCNTTVYVKDVCTVSGINANYDLRNAAVSITPTVTAPGSSTLSYGNDFTATLNGDDVAQFPIDIDEVGDYTLVLTGTGNYVGTKTYHFTVIGDHVRITLVEDVATYSSNDDLNFTGLPLNAYIAAGYNKEQNKVLLVHVYDVPAGTGIFLRGQAGESYNIPKNDSQSYYVNMLKAHITAGSVAQTEGSLTNFLLGKVNDDIKFYAASANASLGDNKAYLQVPTSFLANNNAREVEIVFEEDVTGIGNLTPALSEGEGAWYDLQGRLVTVKGLTDTKSMKKGLYIHNGKKIVIK